MGITFIYDVTGGIENMTFLNHYSTYGQFISFIYLREEFNCNNISINNSENLDVNSIPEGNIISLWKANASFSNFFIEKMGVFRIFDIEFNSIFNLYNVSISALNCVNNEGGSLFLLTSYSAVMIYNITINDIDSTSEIISLTDSNLTINSMSIFGAVVSGVNSKQYLITAETSFLFMNNVYIKNYSRSILLTSGSSLNFENLSTQNMGNTFLTSDLYYSYSAIELFKTKFARIINCNFSYSNNAQYGGVYYKILKFIYKFFRFYIFIPPFMQKFSIVTSLIIQQFLGVLYIFMILGFFSLKIVHLYLI